MSAVDAFAVEYYRTLSSGVPREVYNTAMLTSVREETAPKRVAAMRRREERYK